MNNPVFKGGLLPLSVLILVKVKAAPLHAKQVQMGGRGISLPTEGICGHCHTLAALALGKRPGTHCTGDGDGPWD